MCCGNKREALQQRRRTTIVPTPPPFAIERERTPLVFRGSGSYLVTGSHTRQVYLFSSAKPLQPVDSEDVSQLLSTGLFEAAN